ncbi:hypothetical protein FNAPI_6520 [Fusarium napiforme]|uniref:Uncharacterized protein n=1 Tax=Fusarium napiforme TaxID=42672 RepID=A0A8H5N759_9HYPO|nr:hypothetical protein FNAPI_6520 [Fusarium napiforme]
MALSKRDAIHVDDLERYDEFLKTVTGRQYLHFYKENSLIKIDVHNYPSDELTHSGEFKPSPNADAFFKQMEDIEDEDAALQESSSDALESREACQGGGVLWLQLTLR